MSPVKFRSSTLLSESNTKTCEQRLTLTEPENFIKSLKQKTIQISNCPSRFTVKTLNGAEDNALQKVKNKKGLKRIARTNAALFGRQKNFWKKYPLELETVDVTLCDFIPAMASFTSMINYKKKTSKKSKKNFPVRCNLSEKADKNVVSEKLDGLQKRIHGVFRNKKLRQVKNSVKNDLGKFHKLISPELQVFTPKCTCNDLKTSNMMRRACATRFVITEAANLISPAYQVWNHSSCIH